MVGRKSDPTGPEEPNAAIRIRGQRADDLEKANLHLASAGGDARANAKQIKRRVIDLDRIAKSEIEASAIQVLLVVAVDPGTNVTGPNVQESTSPDCVRGPYLHPDRYISMGSIAQGVAALLHFVGFWSEAGENLYLRSTLESSLCDCLCKSSRMEVALGDKALVLLVRLDDFLKALAAAQTLKLKLLRRIRSGIRGS
ncbi:hypothetical protein SISSUDRAFT_1029454 [Sistotremastrum suecicum HHB10207 ss-3]|uniref:Uncharacterized protein n=1 Tax=Sistotremastrum suecicum HHB10207 ss-3 TaxID=1314776 RepID=A0A166IZX3_9AGAM|nr:hypothetical protein SISSUDRAFT_1029454 [Sistotremastrum suecicum HHB10207 ss-3]